MKGIHILIASMAASALALAPTAARADDELEVTMEVVDDLEGLEEEIARMDGPGDNRIEEDLPESEDGDDEDDRGILDQFEEMDGEFDIEDDNDGFEFENEEEEADEEFDAEDDFEEGEDVDDDEFDEIEEEIENEMDGELDVQDSLDDLDVDGDEESELETEFESDAEDGFEDEMGGDSETEMEPGDIA